MKTLLSNPEDSLCTAILFGPSPSTRLEFLPLRTHLEAKEG